MEFTNGIYVGASGTQLLKKGGVDETTTNAHRAEHRGVVDEGFTAQGLAVLENFRAFLGLLHCILKG